MLGSRYLIGLFGLLLLSSISSAYTLFNNALYCTDCTDCTNALNNDTYNITYLNATISGAAGTCISDPGLIDNRIFDCNNYTISGSGAGNGFFTSGELNATVRGCNISGFLYGILISDNSHNCTVENCITYNNTNTGTFIDSSSDVTVLNSLSYNNTNYGFRIRDSDDTELDNATAYDNQNGFYLYNADRTLINNSASHNNIQHGIYITSVIGDSLNNTVKNTYSYNNGNNGFYLDTANTIRTVFDNCTATNNTDDGFSISSGDYSIINNSVANLSGRDGIRFANTGVIQSSIISTRSFLNEEIGINIQEGCNNDGLVNVSAYNNGNHGIYLSTGDNNVLAGYLGNPISAYDNNGSGIYLYKQTNILLDGNFPPFTGGIVVQSNLGGGL
ncbi:right-handed parallel beta-helix repeat-containing protein, partial [Candidatus Micrarchaeota archaeon]|nr:right-handed parallel beta-helix repeat-containing protein [Candidatus Micrarchaeota archaeon]